MAVKKLPGTNVEVSERGWAAGVCLIIVVFAGQLSSILSAVADYQNVRDGCVRTIAAFFGGF